MTQPPPDSSIAALPPAVLDAQALANLRQLDPGNEGGLLHRVLDTYRSSLARLMLELDGAQRRADAAGMRLAVHTLKSSSASVGARDLSGLCGDAEQALREGRLAEVAALLGRLRTEAGRVDAAVQQLLAN